MKGEPSTEQMKDDLEKSGWVNIRSTTWRDPRGFLFRGPYGAWLAYRRMLEAEKAS